MSRNVIRDVGIQNSVNRVVSRNNGLVRRRSPATPHIEPFTEAERERIDLLDSVLTKPENTPKDRADITANVIGTLTTRRRRIRSMASAATIASGIVGIKYGVDLADAIHIHGIPGFLVDAVAIVGTIEVAMTPADKVRDHLLRTDEAVLEHAMDEFNQNMNGTTNLGLSGSSHVRTEFSAQISEVLDRGADRTWSLEKRLQSRSLEFENLAEANSRPQPDFRYGGGGPIIDVPYRPDEPA